MNIHKTSPAESAYLGCWTDTSDRDIDGVFFSENDMTVDNCKRFCAAEGYSFAGLQAGSLGCMTHANILNHSM